MTDESAPLAPGCYGISLLYREGSNECSTCPFAGQCARLAREQHARLGEELHTESRARKLMDGTRERVQKHRAASKVLPATPDAAAVKAAAVGRREILRADTSRATAQFRGRASMIAKVWLIRTLHPGISDNKVATMIGRGLNKSSVRGYREIIARLEAPGGVWAGEITFL